MLPLCDGERVDEAKGILLRRKPADEAEHEILVLVTEFTSGNRAVGDHVACDAVRNDTYFVRSDADAPDCVISFVTGHHNYSVGEPAEKPFDVQINR